MNNENNDSIVDDNATLFAVYGADGTMYTEWTERFRKLATAIGRDNPPLFDHRLAKATRTLDESHALTHFTTQRSKFTDSTAIDLLPTVEHQDTWNTLNDAVNQRRHLLNLIYTDIYGPRRLLKGSKLPSELIFANPDFLRCCQNLLTRTRCRLGFYTVDVARASDGSLWAEGDSLDAPSGLGLAMRTRGLSLTALSDLTGGFGVGQWDDDLHVFGESLSDYAPHNRDKPGVALLSPGCYNPFYTEHVSLSRALAIPLVEGADLAVRQNRLFLKTTSGLEQIDVLLRFLRSEWLDPLETRDDSLLGAPGLINAIREGNVAVLNPPGCGVLETPALRAFLPEICQNLLGESLRLPSIETWWLGVESARRHVTEKLERFIIRPTFPSHPNARTYFGPGLTKEEIQQLKAQIEAHPIEFTAEAVIERARVPTLLRHGLSHAYGRLRVFSCQPPKEPGKLFTGGRMLASHAAYPEFARNDADRRQWPKDVWIPSDKKDAPDSRSLKQESRFGARLVQTSLHSLPSRIADNLYWLGRYTERADSTARALIVATRAMRHSNAYQHSSGLYAFISGICEYCAKPSGEKPDSVQGRLSGIQKLTMDTIYGPHSGSLMSTLAAVDRVYRIAQDRICGNVAPALTDIEPIRQELAHRKDSPIVTDAILDELIGLVRELTYFSGIIAENTTRDQHWLFLDVGRRIERSIGIASLLRCALADRTWDDEYILSLLLDYCDSSVTYRRRYLTSIYIEPALDLMLLDLSNPRSLAFQSNCLRLAVEKLPHHRFDRRHPIDHQALRLYSAFWMPSLSDLTDGNSDVKRTGFCNFLDQLRRDLASMSDAFAEYYFAITSQI